MVRRPGRWWGPAAGLIVIVLAIAAVLLVVLPGRTRAGATGTAGREAVQPGHAAGAPSAGAGTSVSPSAPHPVSPRKPAAEPLGPTDGRGLTIVGDSLTDGPRSWIEQALPAAVIRAKGFQKWSWGMAQLPQLRAAGQLRPTLAFLMGTNFGATETDVDNLIAAAPEVRTFILMTIHVPPRLQQLYGARTNAVITAAAARHPTVTIKVDDWNAFASAHSDLLLADGIHPGPLAAAPLAQLLRATVYGLPRS
jgi:hypothetical protein